MLGVPLALVLVLGGERLPSRAVSLGLALLALLFLGNAVLGAYHAGIEWKFWPGPSACSPGAAGPASGNLIEDLKATRIVPCDAASWRFLGLSFAGWNVVISLALASVAFAGTRRSNPLPACGSSTARSREASSAVRERPAATNIVLALTPVRRRALDPLPLRRRGEHHGSSSVSQ